MLYPFWHKSELSACEQSRLTWYTSELTLLCIRHWQREKGDSEKNLWSSVLKFPFRRGDPPVCVGYTAKRMGKLTRLTPEASCLYGPLESTAIAVTIAL